MRKCIWPVKSSVPDIQRFSVVGTYPAWSNSERIQPGVTPQKKEDETKKLKATAAVVVAVFGS